MPTKIWDGQNANHRKKSGQNANFWLAFRPVGILSGWHFVRTPLRKRTSTVLHSLRKVRVQLINNNNFIQIGDCVFCGMAMPAWRILYWLNSLFHNWPIEKCLDNVENLLNLSQTSLSIGDCIFCRLANAMLTFRIPNIGLNFLFRAIPCPEVHKTNTTTHFW